MTPPDTDTNPPYCDFDVQGAFILTPAPKPLPKVPCSPVSEPSPSFHHSTVSFVVLLSNSVLNLAHFCHLSFRLGRHCVRPELFSSACGALQEQKRRIPVSAESRVRRSQRRFLNLVRPNPSHPPTFGRLADTAGTHQPERHLRGFELEYGVSSGLAFALTAASLYRYCVLLPYRLLTS